MLVVKINKSVLKIIRCDNGTDTTVTTELTCQDETQDGCSDGEADRQQ